MFDCKYERKLMQATTSNYVSQISMVKNSRGKSLDLVFSSNIENTAVRRATHYEAMDNDTAHRCPTVTTVSFTSSVKPKATVQMNVFNTNLTKCKDDLRISNVMQYELTNYKHWTVN